MIIGIVEILENGGNVVGAVKHEEMGPHFGKEAINEGRMRDERRFVQERRVQFYYRKPVSSVYGTHLIDRESDESGRMRNPMNRDGWMDGWMV